ncbi:hypothetical protein BC941DRAFT_437154 [Chlamydoabsidia padenii]|nr:hypothetical protein BC941DRAFT_437154 [Chlamydoabsidia padenii]
MSDNDPEVLEKEKHKQINKKNKDWHEKLATHSEASVKADKHDKSHEEMVNESVKHLKDIDKE